MTEFLDLIGLPEDEPAPVTGKNYTQADVDHLQRQLTGCRWLSHACLVRKNHPDCGYASGAHSCGCACHIIRKRTK